MLVLVDIYQFNENLFPKKEGINIKIVFECVSHRYVVKIVSVIQYRNSLKKDNYIYSNLRYGQISGLIIL